MKDVQQQDFYQTASLRVTEVFPKTLISFYCVCLLVFFRRLLAFKIDE